MGNYLAFSSMMSHGYFNYLNISHNNDFITPLIHQFVYDNLKYNDLTLNNNLKKKKKKCSFSFQMSLVERLITARSNYLMTEVNKNN